MDLPLTPPLQTFLFWLFFILWSLSELLGPARRRGSSIKRADDRHSTIIIAISTVVGMVLSLLCSSVFRFLNMPLLFYIGIGCILIGTCWRWYAIWTLGRFFTGMVVVAEDHRLIEHGPYRYVRHPAYAGILLVVFGFGLMMTNLLSGMTLMTALLCGLLYRMSIEEQALGETYQAYIRRTWRLLPFLY